MKCLIRLSESDWMSTKANVNRTCRVRTDNAIGNDAASFPDHL